MHIFSYCNCHFYKKFKTMNRSDISIEGPSFNRIVTTALVEPEPNERGASNLSLIRRRKIQRFDQSDFDKIENLDAGNPTFSYENRRCQANTVLIPLKTKNKSRNITIQTKKHLVKASTPEETEEIRSTPLQELNLSISSSASSSPPKNVRSQRIRSLQKPHLTKKKQRNVTIRRKKPLVKDLMREKIYDSYILVKTPTKEIKTNTYYEPVQEQLNTSIIFSPLLDLEIEKVKKPSYLQLLNETLSSDSGKLCKNQNSCNTIQKLRSSWVAKQKADSVNPESTIEAFIPSLARSSPINIQQNPDDENSTLNVSHPRYEIGSVMENENDMQTQYGSTSSTFNVKDLNSSLKSIASDLEIEALEDFLSPLSAQNDTEMDETELEQKKDFELVQSHLKETMKIIGTCLDKILEQGPIHPSNIKVYEFLNHLDAELSNYFNKK